VVFILCQVLGDLFFDLTASIPRLPVGISVFFSLKIIYIYHVIKVYPLSFVFLKAIMYLLSKQYIQFLKSKYEL
jgi:hypothetical protein